MNRRSCICKECWSIHGDAQTAEERGCRGVGGQRRYSLYCPRCNCDWERDFPGYVCILQHVVTQGQDFCKTGWFLLVNFDSNSAIIIEFVDTESFYHTQGGISFKSFVWQGSIDKLIRMARLLQNPEFPEHRLVPEDFNYQHWCCFYDGISAWAGHCSLDWSATCRRVPMPWAHVPAPFGLPECGHNQLPFAKNLKGLLNQSRAATVIQAAWRGWKTRMSVLWNPHTVIGQRRLAAEAGKETNKGKQGLCC